MSERKKLSRATTRAPSDKIRLDNDKMVQGWRDRLIGEMGRQRLSQRGLGAAAKLGSTTVRHLVTSANDISLDTLRKLSNALGVTVVWLSTGAHAVWSPNESDARPRSVRIVPVSSSNDTDPSSPEVDRGYVAVPDVKTPPDARAMLVQNAAMRSEGINAPIAPEHVVLPGDVVIYAKSAEPEIGELVVASTLNGRVVRRLAMNDDGQMELHPNNSSFPRVVVKKQDLVGAVLAVYRQTRQ